MSADPGKKEPKDGKDPRPGKEPKGGKGGVAAATSVSNTAAIHTKGQISDGIHAQSIGGSGGRGGSAYTVLVQAESGSNFNIGATVGGTGGSGQNAGWPAGGGYGEGQTYLFGEAGRLIPQSSARGRGPDGGALADARHPPSPQPSGG